MKNIKIWSDFACPFCFIGEKRLQDAIEDLGLKKEFKIDYRAFELDRHAPKEIEGTTIDRIAEKYHLAHEEAKERVDAIDKAGNEAGLIFRYATARPSNTLDAHRLMKLAENKYDEKVTEALNKGLMTAYFTDNRRLSDHEVLMQEALNAGMKREEVSRVLNSNDFVEQVRHDESEAERLGVHGVPFIVFDDKIAVPGAISVDDFKKVLLEVMGKREDADVSHAQSCDENGCAVK